MICTPKSASGHVIEIASWLHGISIERDTRILL